MIEKPTYEDLEQKVEELEKINQEWKENEKLYKQTFDLLPSFIGITTMHREYVKVNQIFIDIGGFSKKEMIGKTASELNIWVNPDDRKKLVNGLNQANTEHRTRNSEFRRKKKAKR